jgi:hypothetical protein
MSDTQVQEPEQAEAAPTPEAATEEKAAPTPKVTELKNCLCSTFEIVGKKADGELDEEDVFNTGCEQKTKRTFAQGHDARLVSFLVTGHFDDYVLRQVVNGVARTFATPADAAALASDSLRDKAAGATANQEAKRQEKKARDEAKEKAKAAKAEAKAKAAADKAAAKAQADAEKAAAKTSAPKEVAANVVAGSGEGEVAPAPGQAKVKVGRHEYDATIDAEGNATFTDGKGEVKTIERDGYRLLG